MVKLSFLGAARSVTGSQFLVDTGTTKVLVDCGLVQGCHHCEGINTRPFAFNPKEIDAVVVTHAHIDHSGLLPKLVAEGFRGPIYATPATRDFAALLLEDSIQVMLGDVGGREDALPYKENDVAPTVAQFETAEYEKEIRVASDVSFTLHDAGHVLGSAIVELVAAGIRIGFSGDLGNPPTPLLRNTETLKAADYLVVESTYGDRVHEDRETRKELLHDIIDDTIHKRGVLMMPIFAFERAQEILFELNDLREHQKIPQVPVFIDSPMAIKATEIYKRYPQYYNREATYLIASGDDLFKFPGLSFTPTVEESKRINEVAPPKVILAGGGMMQGGRISHHALRYLPDPHSSLLIVGYQAAGSLGRRLLARPPKVRIFEKDVVVRARIKAIGGYSAHADQNGLLEWVLAPQGVKRVFVVHGEEAASLALRQRIRDETGLDAVVPYLGSSVTLQ